ncbi:hypothetical protein GQ600_4904 [Phytophthora cactorum]|nr:hypothetical protein GQ600_4904 [Phytophthora cactorum]
MGTGFRRTPSAVVLALLFATVVATSQAAQQSFVVMSKLRGFNQASFIQQQGYPYSSAIVSYRRLDATSTEAEASDKANQVGASVRKAIKQLRGGTDKFYHDLITAVKITYDDNGDPVKLPVSKMTDDETVNAYSQGLCEVAPNCYWAEIVDGDTSRAKVYAEAESTMDASAAEAKIKEWATGVIGFVIPGIVLGVLKGYTCMQKFLPLLFFLLFAIGVIVVSAAAFLYRGTMLSAVDDLFNATSGTLENGSTWIADDAATQVDKNAGPGVKQLSNVKKQLNTKLVEISGNVQSAVDTQVTTANDLIDTVDKTQGDQVPGLSRQLGYAIMALFALALVVIFLANIMHIAYFIGFIILILTFIISAVVLAIGVVLGDACEVTEIFAGNWTVPLGESAKAVDACFQNESLLDVFNLSDKLDFARGGIDFPQLDMSSMFDFSDLEALETSTNNIDEASFGFDKAPSSGSEADYIENYYNAYTLCTNNGANPDSTTTGMAYECMSKSSCSFSAFMKERYTVLFPLATLKAGMENFKAQLSKDVSEITATSGTFETNTKKLNSDINGIKDDLDAHLIEYVGDFEDAMYCTFIADGFWIIYDSLCGDLMPSITMIALMLFLCGLFLIPVNVCLIIGVKRLKAHGNGHIMDTEMKFK